MPVHRTRDLKLRLGPRPELSLAALSDLDLTTLDIARELGIEVAEVARLCGRHGVDCREKFPG